MAAREYDTDRNWKDNLARILAGLALVLSLAALGWAAKADNKAQDAQNKANQNTAMQSSSAGTTTTGVSPKTSSGPSMSPAMSTSPSSNAGSSTAP
jgi:hypothetical protein